SQEIATGFALLCIGRSRARYEAECLNGSTSALFFSSVLLIGRPVISVKVSGVKDSSEHKSSRVIGTRVPRLVRALSISSGCLKFVWSKGSPLVHLFRDMYWNARLYCTAFNSPKS